MAQKQFKAESKRLLDLMINSIYTHKEIFLRELISNASDATDKLYYNAMKEGKTGITRDALPIELTLDKANRRFIIEDHGCGMTAEELESNLGTIARSGSLAFKAENEKQDDIDIIGQFGVGFYAAFMVAKHVEVVSRAVGSDNANRWESDGADGYTVTPCEKAENGTKIVLTIKDNTESENYDEFLEPYRVQGLVKKYSDYIRYPIKMDMTRSRMKEKPADAGDDYKPEWEEYTENTTLNSMVPIWKKSKKELKDEDYNNFYTQKFFDYQPPLCHIHTSVEGAVTYTAMLFIPSHAPMDYYTKDYEKGLQLYSNGVLIMDKCEELLPDYFGFVRGVVDSSDLTLNISRETLQHNGQLRAIARRLEKKIKADLANMRDDDREAYEEFFKQFGRTLKFGIYQSYGMAKDTLADLLLFYSAKEQKMITLDEYLADAPAGADSIFFAAGDSLDRLANMPLVTTVLAKGYDVLLCDQDVDEFCMMAMGTYGEHAVDGDEENKQPYFIKNVGSEDLGLTTDEEKKEAEEATESNAELFGIMQEALDGKVERVVVSTRLTDAPAVVTSEGGMSLAMVQVLKSQPGTDELPEMHLVLEVNAKHPVFATLQAAHEADDDEKVRTYAGLLFDQALLVEGILPDNPLAFAQAVAELMK